MPEKEAKAKIKINDLLEEAGWRFFAICNSPKNIFNLEYNGYEDFLIERRKLMSKRIKEYYFSL